MVIHQEGKVFFKNFLSFFNKNNIMQITNAYCTLNINQDHLEYVYHSLFTYDLSAQQKPNYQPQQLLFSNMRRLTKTSLSMSKTAMIGGIVIAVLGIIGVTRGEHEGSYLMMLILTFLAIGGFIFYSGWKRSKLPKAKIKGIQVFAKSVAIHPVVFVSDNEAELQNVYNVLQSKIPSK